MCGVRIDEVADRADEGSSAIPPRPASATSVPATHPFTLRHSSPILLIAISAAADEPDRDPIARADPRAIVHPESGIDVALPRARAISAPA
jgi:hypothetical protein